MEERLVTALLLAKVLIADGMMATAEKARLFEVMQRLDLTEKEREKVLALEGMEDALVAAKLWPEAKRRTLVDGLVEAALVDGKLSPHELREVRTLSDALGV
jgi:uncharacterized tellurite resistance protein B-like protein